MYKNERFGVCVLLFEKNIIDIKLFRSIKQYSFKVFKNFINLKYFDLSTC